MRGTIASEPSIGHSVEGKSLPLMFVDACTRSGSSGSAVIRHRPDGTITQKADGSWGVTTGAQSELLGAYSVRRQRDSGLGYVWSIHEVDPICYEGM